MSFDGLSQAEREIEDARINPSKLIVRVQELEVENARLRREVAELRNGMEIHGRIAANLLYGQTPT
jgi:hypothetical protein